MHVLALTGATFEACWARPLALLDAANVRGHGHSAAGLAAAEDWPEFNNPHAFYLKRQQAFYCHPVWNMGLPTPTLRREFRQLQFARSCGLPVPAVLAYGEASSGRAMLAVAAIQGCVSLDAALQRTATDRLGLLTQVGVWLAHMHRLRIRHGALYPKHILVRPDAPVGARIWFIDFEKARRALSQRRCMRDDLQQLSRRAPFLDEADRAALAEGYGAAQAATARSHLQSGAEARG